MRGIFFFKVRNFTCIIHTGCMDGGEIVHCNAHYGHDYPFGPNRYFSDFSDVCFGSHRSGRHFRTKLMSRYIGTSQNDQFDVRMQELVSKAKNPGGFLRKNVF